MAGQVTTVTQCKVCTSKMRVKIEELYNQGLVPEKIHEYLHGLSDPKEKAIVEGEDISPSSMRRHFKKHFNVQDGAKVAVAEIRSRVQQSRNLYSEGVRITVDTINTLSHMIETSLINIEELEHTTSKHTDRHKLTIAYMSNIRGLIETLSKLTGELKQEGSIDINFFNGEIQVFADLVLETIREVDAQLGLGGVLEQSFATEFQRQWVSYNDRLNRIAAGELTVADAHKDLKVNRFNQS